MRSGNETSFLYFIVAAYAESYISRLRRGSGLVLCALGLLLVAPLASAEGFYGVGPTCKYHTIQAAINALIANDHNFDPAIYLTTIALAANTTFPEGSLSIDSSSISWPNNAVPFQGAVVQIVGGYDQTCDNPDPSASAASTVIDANGKSGSALFIHGGSYNYVILSNLTLANANNTSGGATGGGINFSGNGRLDIDNVTILNNEASYGAGIYANGSGSGITLTLHSGTVLQNNLARNAGGGIRIEGKTHLNMLESQTSIFDNTANTNSSDGTGGGLQIYGSGATADIGSAGYFGVAAVDFNHARNGGGIAVQNGGGLRLFSAEGPPAGIAENVAANAGGGLFVDAGSVCGSGYAINGNTAGVQNVSVGDGAAIFMTGNSAGDIHLTETQLAASDGEAGTPCGHGLALPPRFGCPPGGACNQINDNINIPDNALETITVSGSAFFVADRFEARRNTAGILVRALGSAKLGDCLIEGNTDYYATISAEGGDVQINGCTIAGNVITGPNTPLIYMGNTDHILTLANSILALNRYANASGPVPSLSMAAGTLHASDIIASETVSLTAHGVISNVNSYDPKFVDAAHGDYHLRPESPAVNYRLSNDPATFFGSDLDGNPRGQAVPFAFGNSLFDIGAYEVQNLGETIFFNSFNP